MTFDKIRIILPYTCKVLQYKELYMIRAKNGPLANIDDFFPVGSVSGNMFIYT